MSEDEKVISTQTLRNAVNLALEQKSSRALAREIGISPTGLKKFAEGSGELYWPTRRRMQAWYREFRKTLPQAPDPAVVAAAVDVLLGGMPVELQREPRDELSDILGKAYAGLEGGALAAAVPLWPGARTLRQSARQAPAASAQAPAQPSRVYLVGTTAQTPFLLADLPPGAAVFTLPGSMPRA